MRKESKSNMPFKYLHYQIKRRINIKQKTNRKKKIRKKNEF